MAEPGVLYVVATPIGNMGDISARAREILAGVGAVAAEDTRHSGRLLRELGLERPLVSLHEHNERARVARARRPPARRREHRARVRRRHAARERSGLPARRGRGRGRHRRLAGARPLRRDRRAFGRRACPATASASRDSCPRARRRAGAGSRSWPRRRARWSCTRRRIASPNASRILRDACGADRRACIARELTKRFETFYRGRLGELAGARRAMRISRAARR